jgi:hypothetical protein
VFHQFFQLSFGAVCSEVSDLRFEGNGQVGCGVDNLSAKIIDFASVALHTCWELAGLRVKAHAQQGAVLALSALQMF